MNLLEFITYCELSDLVLYRMKLAESQYKTLIRRDNVEVAMIYKLVDDDATIIKCTLNDGEVSHLSPALKTIVEVFFPG